MGAGFFQGDRRKGVRGRRSSLKNLQRILSTNQAIEERFAIACLPARPPVSVHSSGVIMAVKGKKIAVVLSGCGNKDGAEITEVVSLIVALSEKGADVSFFAPDQDMAPVNFLTNERSKTEKRNVMIEAARITRSQIQDLNSLVAADFDGLALPGGFGAALELSSWGTKGAACEVLPDLAKTITDFHQQSKPIAAICIAPTLVAKVLGKMGVTVTIGNDRETAQEIAKTGARHEDCPVTDYITDRSTKVVTTPAYMYGNAKPHEVFQGIQGLVGEFLEMA